MHPHTRTWFADEADRICWIDFEASGLGKGTFPTEIGWAYVARTGGITSGSCLIRPIPDWLAVQDSWSPEAERITGITMGMLERDGLACTEAVATFTAAVSGRMVLSDNPPWDGYWLGMLLSAGGVPTDGWRMGDSYKALDHAASLVGGRMIDSLIVDIVAHRDSPRRHRAEPDARRHAVKWGTLAGLVTAT